MRAHNREHSGNVVEPIYRKAIGADLPATTDLLNRYYVGRLSPGERADGFISATFIPEQLRQMNDDIGVFVALLGGNVVGCLCCYDGESPAVPPPYRAMKREFSRWQYHDKPLAHWRVFAYGPVCIDVSARGRGILRGLFTTMLPRVSARYDVGTAFIAKSNERSLAAHCTQLGMAPVGEFTHAGERFVAVAFGVDPQ